MQLLVIQLIILFICSPIGVVVVVVVFGRQMHTPLSLPPQASVLAEACCWIHFLGHGGKEVNRVDQEEAEVVGWEVAAFIGILGCAVVGSVCWRGGGGIILWESMIGFFLGGGFFFTWLR